MNKIILTAILCPLSLFSVIDESKINAYLHDCIEEKCFQITHTAMSADPLETAYQIGYFTALSHICYKIETHQFEGRD